MELSLSLMRAGSHQVEMSDEGLMADDIEECWKNVGEAERDCRDEASVQLGREVRSCCGNSHPLRRDADMGHVDTTMLSTAYGHLMKNQKLLREAVQKSAS